MKLRNVLPFLIIPALSYAAIYELVITVESDTAPEVVTRVVQPDPGTRVSAEADCVAVATSRRY